MIVEVFSFRLRPDVSDDEFLAADARVQTEFYYQQRGIARRTTAKAEDGEWAVVVFWGDEASAAAAAEASVAHPATQAFGAFLDHSSLHSKRYASLD